MRFRSMCSGWGADQRGHTIKEENWHSWMRSQGLCARSKAKRDTQSLKACLEQWRRHHLNAAARHNVAPQRRQVMKKGLKQLAGKRVLVGPEQGASLTATAAAATAQAGRQQQR